MTTPMHIASAGRSLRRFLTAPRRCMRDPAYTSRSWSSVASRYSTTSRPIPHRSAIPRIPWADRRTFISTSPARAAVAQKQPSQKMALVSYPSTPAQEVDEEDEDVPDVELVPPEEAVIEITDRAAEQLRTIAQREKDPAAALRVSVESGGCHGYQYKMALEKRQQPDDYHFEHPQIKPSNLYIDAVSMTLLKGSMIDFATELIGSSFRVQNNPQSKDSGCGCGVSWELKT